MALYLLVQAVATARFESGTVLGYSVEPMPDPSPRQLAAGQRVVEVPDGGASSINQLEALLDRSLVKGIKLSPALLGDLAPMRRTATLTAIAQDMAATSGKAPRAVRLGAL